MRLHTWARRALDASKVVAPYLALFSIYLVARLLALQGFQNPIEAYSFLSMFMTWPSVLWFYIQHLIYPMHLIPFYMMEHYSHPDVHNVLLPAISVLAVGAGLWLWASRSPRAAVAGIWVVVPLLPVLDLRAFIQGHLVHDRYLYLSSFGFALLVAMGLRHIKLGSVRHLGQPAIQLVLAGMIGLAMGLEGIQATACYTNQAAFSAYVTNTEGCRSNNK